MLIINIRDLTEMKIPVPYLKNVSAEKIYLNIRSNRLIIPESKFLDMKLLILTALAMRGVKFGSIESESYKIMKYIHIEL